MISRRIRCGTRVAFESAMGNDIRHVGWSLGNYCNAKCAHCYSWKVRQSPRVLEKPDIDRILGELERAGVKTVNLGGNEPLFTNGPEPRASMLPYIVERATAAKMTIGVTTNGTTALWLARHEPAAFDRIHEWHFSIDSPDREAHDANRGGAFYALVIEALALAKARGAKTALVYCAMRGNVADADADALLDLAKQEQCELRVNTLKPTDPHHTELFPSRAEVFRFFARLAQRSEPVVVGESVLAALWGLPAEGCPCGTTSLRIHSITDDGKVPVSPCVFLHDLKVGDLLTQSLDELIAAPEFRAMRDRRTDLPSECRTAACGYESSCRGGCAARAFLTTGNLDAKDPYCPDDATLVELASAPPPLELRIAPDRIRVHERYLCTVIHGVPR